MSLELVGLVLAVLAAVCGALWAAAPLWRSDLPAAPPDPLVISLLAEREAVLGNLRDLDADRADGRIGPEEYARQRTDLVTRGARIIEALDRTGGSRQVGGDEAAPRADRDGGP